MGVAKAITIICIRCEERLELQTGSRPGAGSALCPECGATYHWYRVPDGIVLEPVHLAA